MIHLLCLCLPLLATIHEAKFATLDLNDQVCSAVLDIENKNFWKALYPLLRALYPAIRALPYCNSTKPTMDKIYYLSYLTTEAITQSCNALDDTIFFGGIDENDSSL